MSEMGFEHDNIDNPTGLYDHIDALEQSEHIVFGTMSAFLDVPDQTHGDAIATVCTDHAKAINNVLECILECTDLEATEKAVLLATIVRDDDINRVNFLNEICGEDGFSCGYSSLPVLTEKIVELFEEADDDEEVRNIMLEQHLEYLNLDIVKFMTNPSTKNSLEAYGKALEFRDKVVNLGLTSLAAAIGTGAVLWWFKKNQR